MGRATTRTMLPLDRWAEIIGLDPRHFNQVTVSQKPTTVCSTVWKQYAWQENSQVGREDVAEAIAQAEEIISQHVGYRLLPSWEVNERVLTPQPGNPEIFNVSGRMVNGARMNVRSRWGHFISGGVEGKTLIDDDVATIYSDQDGDGYPETATITVATTVTDPDELAVYVPASHVLVPSGGLDEFEIRPLRRVTIAAGVATIVMWRHQLVIPQLTEALEPTAVDGNDNANFLTVTDVYRHFNDFSSQATLIWSPIPVPDAVTGSTCGCGSSTCVACTFSTQEACLLAWDHRLGLITYQPATFDSVDQEFDAQEFAVCRNPDRLLISYYAGFEDKAVDRSRITMSRYWQYAVTYFSLAILDRQLCDCNNLENAVKKWSGEFNLSLSTPGSSASYQIGSQILDNPFGASRGAVYAWQKANAEGNRLGRAVRY